MDIRNFFAKSANNKRKRKDFDCETTSNDNSNNNNKEENQNTAKEAQNNEQASDSPAAKRRKVVRKSKYIEDSDSDNSGSDKESERETDIKIKEKEKEKENDKSNENDCKIGESPPLSMSKFKKPLESVEKKLLCSKSKLSVKNESNNSDKSNDNNENERKCMSDNENGNDNEHSNDDCNENDESANSNDDDNEDDNDGDDNESDECESFEDDEIETDEDDDLLANKNAKKKSNDSSNGTSSTSIKEKIKRKNGKKGSKTKSSNKIFRGSNYDPIKEAGFKKNASVPYMVIAQAFEKMEATTKRLEKIELMSNLFRSVILLNPSELLYVVYLCCNKIAPPYAGLELGVGDQVIIKALCESTGRALKDMKADLKKSGDLGIVAEKSRAKQRTMFKPQALTAKKVFDTFIKVASTSGHKSMQEKVRNIQLLFVAAREPESRYIVRHLQGKMRMGVNEQTVLAALGRACAFEQCMQKELIVHDNDTTMAEESKTNDNSNDNSNNDKTKTKENENDNSNEKETPFSKGKRKKNKSIAEKEIEYTGIMKQVISELPNYEMVIPKLIEVGINNLHKFCHLTAGIPIKAMLAKPTKGVSEILERFANMRFTLEYKYDGERAQIHLFEQMNPKTKEMETVIKVFSRNAEDNTEKFPDLITNMPRFIDGKNVKSFIIDSEVVAYDRESKKILPFQELTKRKRKSVKEEDITIQVCIYAFDMLYLNGESLIELPFAKRREKLYESFHLIKGEFGFADHKDTSDPEEISEFLNKAVTDYCEGLMVKTLDVDATYEPSKRSLNWLKCKKDYLDGVGDTLDLVVMGAWHGAGKRTGTFGSYLVGCYDEESDGYQSVTKVATGLSDDNLKHLTEKLTKSIVNQKPIEYQSNMECDVWFEAKHVWEIKCADMTISPVHLGGIGIVHETKGIALRFPRFIRERDDKQAEMATNANQVVEMYQSQQQLQ